MKHEVKKICKIVDELTTLFLKEDTNEVDFKIITQPDRAIVKIVDYNTKYSEEFIAHLKKTLNNQRQSEIEEYYWQLAGETDDDDELTLISVMIDSATVEKRDGNLYIELVRINK
ncbi:hypothetical protein QE109_13920 [Fusibacter bizertensis]|uniref:Na+-translocating membrane potential-generating system MpsC domain-containing protein n=1 Tax=Fusibacter bizertensis TaxID=1488331 RepID=A0ABT6NFP2_9FIRM|nr:hypothetical protein [Fusibacter bizertensis]MDH8679250.1 hypothetical protein [Fusibacter bizertensis]